MARLELVVNGRFTTQSISGVQRFAHNITAALCDIAKDAPDMLSVELVVPSRSAIVAPPQFDISIRQAGILSGHAWEQIELPIASRGKMLFSPCNTGPVVVRRQAVTMHDAQVYQTPESYSWPFRTWYKTLQPKLASRADVVTTDSLYSLEALRHVKVLASDKGSVVHAAVDHILDISADDLVLSRQGLEPHRYVLAIGSLSPHKNIKTITAAMASVKTPFPLVVAGGGNSSVFADAGLQSSERVRFIGRVTDAELCSLYAHAAMLVFPSYFEGFGLPPLEAMLLGCPVIASTGGSIPEICGDAADYVSPENPVPWAAAIDRLVDEPQHAARLAELGRQRARQFTWRKSAEQLLECLRTSSSQRPQ